MIGKAVVSHRSVMLLFVIFAALVAALSWAAPARAAGIVVTSGDDTAVAGDGDCTLREAINNANSDSDTTGGDCDPGAGPDTITFDADYTITLAGSQLPTVTSEITIDGNGTADTIIQASTCNPVTLPGGCTPAGWRVLHVDSGGDLTLQYLTVRHGRCEGTCIFPSVFGGGILNSSGTLTLTDSAVTDNLASDGGGVYNSDVLNVNNTTFSGNQTGGGGGAITNNSGIATVRESTFSFNRAVNFSGGAILNYARLFVYDSVFSGNEARNRGGGGIYTIEGTTTVSGSLFVGNLAGGGGGLGSDGVTDVINSTFYGNAGEIGGGLFNQSVLTLTNVTVSGNLSSLDGLFTDQGGGLYHADGTTTLIRSIISGNASVRQGKEIFFGGDGSIVADEFNVFGHAGLTDADAYFNFTPGASDFNASSDDQNVPLADILDTSLASNGGPTLTLALAPGSPALDFGPSADCSAAPVNGVDQRGFPRNVNIPGVGSDTTNLCDTGAYEEQTALARLTVTKATDPAGGTGFPFTIDTGLYTDYTFDGEFGSGGTGEGEFFGPVDVATDAAGNIYVTDGGNDRVQIFNPDGTFKEMWGWGVDDGSAAFQICTSGCQFGIAGNGNGQFSNPRGIAVDASGNVIVVSEFPNPSVQKLDSSGGFLWSIIATGGAEGQLNGPIGVDVDAAGNIYVADTLNARIQKFDADGNFLRTWGKDVDTAGGAGAEICTSSCQAGTSGTAEGEFNKPDDVAVDSAGNVWVVDKDNRRIQKFDSDGNFLLMVGWGVDDGTAALQTCTSGCQAGIAGTGVGQFDLPRGATVDAADKVYISDYFAHRIQVFSGTGAYLGVIGQFGSGNGEFQNPWGLQIGATGKLYVVDSNNNRVQSFATVVNFILDDGQSEVFDLPPGTYPVTELVPDGWELTDITCDTEGYGGFVPGDTTASVELATGDNVSCTFTNTRETTGDICPVESPYVGTVTTTILGKGLFPNQEVRVNIPNSAEATNLYAQLAGKKEPFNTYTSAVFRPLQGTTPLATYNIPGASVTSKEWRTWAIFWFGRDLSAWDGTATAVRGRLNAATSNPPPIPMGRALIVYADYPTKDEAEYWNYTAQLDVSLENHVYWGAGWIPSQTYVVDLDAALSEARDIAIQAAVVDNDADTRPFYLTITALDTNGDPLGAPLFYNPTGPSLSGGPGNAQILNLIKGTLAAPAGTVAIEFHLESPRTIGESAALVGVAANYACVVDER